MAVLTSRRHACHQRKLSRVRRAVLAALEARVSTRRAAQVGGVSLATIDKWKREVGPDRDGLFEATEDLLDTTYGVQA